MLGNRLEIAKEVAKRKFHRRHMSCIWTYSVEWADRQLKKMRKTGTICSCPMCGGNPRKWFGKKTRQELSNQMEKE